MLAELAVYSTNQSALLGVIPDHFLPISVIGPASRIRAPEPYNEENAFVNVIFISGEDRNIIYEDRNMKLEVPRGFKKIAL